VGLGSLFLLAKDRPHTQIMFCRTECIFNLGELNVRIPQGFWISLPPVGAEDVAAVGFERPPSVVPSRSLCHDMPLSFPFEPLL
jgi:hypothetical protein